MPVSEAKKKANSRWNASKDNIMIRPTKEEGAAIRAAAVAAGQSNQQYILGAVAQRMAQEDTGGAGGISLPPSTIKAAQEAAKAAGEAVPVFIDRAVTTQAQRDITARKLGGGG